MIAARDEYENSILAAGGVFALLWDALAHHNALEAVEVVTDPAGHATNQIEISLSFMNSPYRLTVERVQPAAEPSFRCPRCMRVSYHPEDVRHGYCGACHAFTGTEQQTDWADTGSGAGWSAADRAPKPAIVPTDAPGQPE